MANLANITAVEIAAVSAAVLLFFMCPAVLAWTDHRRRRRLQAAQVTVSVAAHVPIAGERELPGQVAPEMFSEGVEAAEIGSASVSDAPPPVLADAQSSVEHEESGPKVEIAPPVSVDTAPAAMPPVEIRPLAGPSRHRFRLEDLHDARLPDWPPAAIRNDPERDRAWQNGERAYERHRERIAAVTIWSPYPARSRCLGAVETPSSTLRLHFLLFPVLWPVSQNQAVAQAVFEIDPEGDQIHGWLDALQEHELTDDLRRDIRACSDA